MTSQRNCIFKANEDVKYINNAQLVTINYIVIFLVYQSDLCFFYMLVLY